MDYDLSLRVQRDICFLYHEQADYSYIMGDLSYTTLYQLPYWNFLDSPGIDKADHDFIRDGCLVMMLAMAWDEIDGSGVYISSHLTECRDAIAGLICDDEDLERLARIVKLALDAVEGADIQVLREESEWVHRRYVRGYFQQVAARFERPYFK
jgi:hypothetical protein